MNLIEIFLPRYDNEKQSFSRELFDSVKTELTHKFHGVTVFSRSPAHGIWENNGDITHDDIIIYEVMSDNLDRNWWMDYKSFLEKRFRQTEIIVRTSKIEIL